MTLFRLAPAAVLLAVSTVLAAGQDPAELDRIRAYVQISEALSTSGQITYEQIPLLKEAGFSTVVNLAPADENRNGREGFLVTQQGMTYVQIPVDWQNPSPRDLKLFFDVMDASEGQRVFVHCFANMRVSVFTYLYRTLRQGVPKGEAWDDVLKVWDPTEAEQWKAFIEKAEGN